MSTHKHFDKICCAILAATLLLTVLFVNGGRLGIQISSAAMGYAGRLFHTSSVHTVDIVMEDWDDFISTCTNEEYASCTVIIDGESYKNVGIRAKGNTSLTQVSAYGNDRYSFKIEFDCYDSTKSYYGLDKLCLNNIIQDNTYMKDFLTYQMMAEMGVPSPLCSYANLSVNGETWGLYLALEGVEESFLTRNYGRDYGSLYKPDSMNMGGGRGNGKDFRMDDWRQEQDGNSSEDGGSEDGGSEDSAADGSAPGSSPSDTAEKPIFLSAGPEGNNGIPAFPDGNAQNGKNTQDSNAQGSNTQDGNMQDGNTQDGNMQGGNTQNGNTQDGNTQDGNTQDGNTQDGNTQNGNTQDGNTQDGNTQNGNTQDGNTQDGNMQNGNTQDKDGFSRKMPGGGRPNGRSMGSDDVLLKYVDDDFDSYANIFDNAKTKISDTDKKRLIASLKNLSSGENLADTVDIEAVIRYFVVHNFVLNFDSYTGSMIHNYYLYEKNGRLSMIPWDYNLAFGGFSSAGGAESLVNYPIDSPISGGKAEDRPMIAWIFANEEYTALYHQYFRELITEFFDSGKFTELMDSTKALISPYVEKDPTKFCTYEAFTTGIDTLREFCLLRAQSIQGQLDGSIGSTSETQSQDTLVDAGDIDISDMGSMGTMGNGKTMGAPPSFPDGNDFSSASPSPQTENRQADNATPPDSPQADKGGFPVSPPSGMQEPPEMGDAENFVPPTGMPEQTSGGTMSLSSWILLGISACVLGLGILFALLFQRRR